MMKHGANYLNNGLCSFTLWAPLAEKVELHIISPQERLIPMEKRDHGYFSVETDHVLPGTNYFYRLNGEKDRPDPASHFQSEGVHGPSQVINHQAYRWKDDNWQGIELKDLIIYELHVGTFTPEGTLKAIIGRLDDLVDLGVNAIEIMPISQFPGSRNWGYDGVHPYSVQNSYGTPDDFRQLVDECHARGIAVILDMVYNHLGPEGNYVTEMGPYFINKYHTPWGAALNFDEHYCDPVRDFFAESAVFFLDNYHIDGLRLDAIHAVFDMGAVHFWQYVTEKIEQLSLIKGKRFFTIAESDLNDTKVIRSRETGGWGFDSQWMDDFHHSLHTLLTKEKMGYYADFGSIEHLAKAIQEGYVYNGIYSEYRKRRYGNDSSSHSGEDFVVCIQNHDQVGNRMLGDRITQLLSFEALKLAAATLLLSPYVPMLFMGEEYAEDTPFTYFVSHTDSWLVEAVRNGRKAEFAAFAWLGEAPDPQAEATFQSSILQWYKRNESKHQQMYRWYKQLIQLRKERPALHHPDRNNMQVSIAAQNILVLQRWHESDDLLCLLNFSDLPTEFRLEGNDSIWQQVLDSTDTKFGGTGSDLPYVLQANTRLQLSPCSVTVYERRGAES
jgi:maltooligosyltrehalose trehalohydrolase